MLWPKPHGAIAVNPWPSKMVEAARLVNGVLPGMRSGDTGSTRARSASFSLLGDTPSPLIAKAVSTNPRAQHQHQAKTRLWSRVVRADPCIHKSVTPAW